MRIISFIIGIIFILFALVQLNDPDFLVWFGAYTLTATVAFVFPFRKPNKHLLLAMAIIYLIAAIALFPPSISEWISAEEEASSLGMKLPGIEQAREAMGLILCFFTVSFYWLKSSKG